MLNEIAYQNHIKNAKKAEVLYQALRELYGNEIDKQTLSRRARFDKMITDDEFRLLKEFAFL